MLRATLVLRKGGEVVIKKATDVAVKDATAAAVAKVAGEAPLDAAQISALDLKPGEQLPLNVPRAVTAEEAPYIRPERESTKTTMMPWKGWISRWLKEKMGDERYMKMRKTVFFIEDDLFDLVQQPYPANKDVPISSTDKTITAQFRTPSPGSQGPVRIPRLDEDEDPFDSGHFKRDTRRQYQHSEMNNLDPEANRIQLELMDPLGKDEEIQAELAKVEEGPKSSPGNKGRFATGPSDFDPSQLRATMSVNWEAVQKELEKHQPDHLSVPIWMTAEEDYTEWYKERDLPIPVGAYYEPLSTPTHQRVARW